MADLFAGWRFGLRRLRANGRLMLVAAAGVLVAATLLAATPIYATAMTDLGLRFRLDRQLAAPADRLAFLEVDRLMLGSPVDRARRVALERIAAARVGWLGTPVHEDRTPRLELSFADAARAHWPAHVVTLTDVEQHVMVVEGRLPGPSAGGLEVVLPDGFQRHVRSGEVVRIAGATLDDCVRVPASQDPNVARDEVPCRPTITAATAASATVVGFVRPRQPADLRWQQFEDGWRVPDRPLPARPGAAEDTRDGLAGVMPLITTHDQFYGALATRMPELLTRHRSGFVIDGGALRLEEVPRAIADMTAWRTDVAERLQLIAPARFTVLDVLQGFQNARTFSQIPLLLILLQVVGIVLYYVVMVMALLVDRQAEEIAVLRSRGATTGQLVGLHAVEGAVLALPAAVLGPWLAAFIVSAIGWLPTFHAITGGAALAVRVTPGAALLAGVGAVLALVALLLPSYAASRRGLVGVRREETRPAERGLVQRYYLDVAFAVLAGFLLWQLRQRGTVFDRGSVGGWSADPLLLLSPLVITLAVALMMLRLVPPVVRLAVRVFLLFRGTAVAIGLRRAGRSPAAYARLMLLVVMAVSVGTFAASYGPTVGRSLDERVRYAAGVDARATIDRPDRAANEAALPAVRAMPGVADAALVHRGTISSPNGNSVALLSIDAGRAPAMLWFREDFAARPMPDVLRLLQSDVRPGGGLPLPEGATAISIRLRSQNLGRSVFIARIRDGAGEFADVVMPLPDRPANGWNTITAPLPPARGPLAFAGFRVADRVGSNLRIDGTTQLDRLTATVNGRPVVIEDFEGPFAWSLYGAPTREETFRAVDGNEPASGSRFAEWKTGATISVQDRMLAPNDPAVPLSAIMNPAAMSALGTTEGGVTMATMNGLQIPLFVRAAADLFPTLDASRGFVVLNHEQLDSIAGAVGATDLRRPNELWLRFREDTSIADRRATMLALTKADAPIRVKPDALVRAALLDDTNADPTLQAAGSGILTVAFIAVLGLSTLGVIVTLVLSARSRAVEFAVLRAVGASSRQVLRSLLVEWGIVLIAGAALGLALGRVVASLMLGFLAVTERGERVLPPFIVQTDWLALAVGIGLLAVVVVATLVATWAATMRRPAAAQLRLTE